MDLRELKKEQYRLSHRIIIKDDFREIKTIGGVDCAHSNNKLFAAVVVLEYPSMKLLEKKTSELPDPLPYVPGFLAYREMPAIIEAFNKLDQEPDVILVDGAGILHPRKIGMASHLGLALNKPTIGLTRKLPFGEIENGKIFFENELSGFEIITKEFANPLYVSPGHFVSMGSCLNIIQKCIKPPHKLPEPIHIASRVAKKESKK